MRRTDQAGTVACMYLDPCSVLPVPVQILAGTHRPTLTHGPGRAPSTPFRSQVLQTSLARLETPLQPPRHAWYRQPCRKYPGASWLLDLRRPDHSVHSAHSTQQPTEPGSLPLRGRCSTIPSSPADLALQRLPFCHFSLLTSKAHRATHPIAKCPNHPSPKPSDILVLPQTGPR